MMVINTSSLLLILVVVAIGIVVVTIGDGKANYGVAIVVVIIIAASNISFTKSVLVVVHPNLEHSFTDTGFIAELFN